MATVQPSLLAKYQEAVQWLGSAAQESLKTSNVDLQSLIRDSEGATLCVRQILASESSLLRISALEQLLATLTYHQAVLVSKKKQLEVANLVHCSSQKRGLLSCVDDRDEQAQRRLRAIEQTILPRGGLLFQSVAGLELAKQALREAIILPVKFPHLFTGGRRPWTRVLLYGPPGTAVSGEADSTFYSISSSNIISSWLGESEKIIRDLFRHAHQSPGKAVIFIDEVDSVCRVRTSREEEHTRRIKTELLKQMEFGDSNGMEPDQNNVFLLCATNCPWELDPAFLRRFQRRIYIPLPNRKARREIFEVHLGPSTEVNLTQDHWETVVTRTEGYSGSDIATCVADALLEPVREMERARYWKPLEGGVGLVPCVASDPGAVEQALADVSPHQVHLRAVSFEDFFKALQRNGATVSEEELGRYEEFTSKFGQSGAH